MTRTPSLPPSVRALRLTALTLLVALTGASVALAGQEKLAASIGETRHEVVATRDQLQATVDALDALVKQKEGDLKPVHDEFVAQVTKTQATAELTKTRSEKMKAAAKEHFGHWQSEIDSIANEKLQKKAKKRLDSVEKGYSKTITKLEEASTSFQPYLSDLADIKKILANDLTKDGIKAIRGTVAQAKFDLRAVRNHLFDAIKELETMERSLASQAGK